METSQDLHDQIRLTSLSSHDPIRKLHSQSDAVRAELAKVFGEEVQVAVEVDPQAPAPDQTAVIVLGVLLGLSLLGLLVTVVLLLQ